MLTRAQKAAETKRRNKDSQERIAKSQAETRAIVNVGKCPLCGESIRRNLSISGWYQCAQLGAEGFRKESSKPACSWQGFTE